MHYIDIPCCDAYSCPLADSMAWNWTGKRGRSLHFVNVGRYERREHNASEIKKGGKKDRLSLLNS